MTTLLMTLILSVARPAASAQVQYQPCVWPNPCVVQAGR